MSGQFERLPEAQHDRLKEARQPDWTQPMLATLTERRFSDRGWIYERKLDGERALAFRSGNSVRLLTRNRKDIVPTYPELVDALSAQPSDDFVVDGEIVAFDGAVTSFSRLQQRLQIKDPDEARGSGVAVYFYLFDILHLSGKNVCPLDLRVRKALLKQVILQSIIWCLFRRMVARSSIEADLVTLRHQVALLQRQVRHRPTLTRWDRLLFAALYGVQPNVLRSISIVQPETVVRWHQAGFRLNWKHKSRGKLGRPRLSAEVRALIKEISVANPLWGAPRIHGELLKLGIDVSQSTVAKYMVRGRRPPSQSWLTFLRNHADTIAAIDLFVVPTFNFRCLFGLVILNHERRQIVHIAATYHPTAAWIARQITEAFPWETAPCYLLRDRDSAYGKIFCQRLSAIGIRDRPTAPRSPWQNGYVERVIGSIRRDLLDHVIVLDEGHLRRLLRGYADYYNAYRTHLGLAKDTPLGRPVQNRGNIMSVAKIGGLHHAYVRI